MWERFTEYAKCVVSNAQEHAFRLGSDFVQTEHILLGVCRGPEGIAIQALDNLGIDFEALATEIEKEASPGRAAITAELIPWALGYRDPVRERVEARQRGAAAE